MAIYNNLDAVMALLGYCKTERNSNTTAVTGNIIAVKALNGDVILSAATVVDPNTGDEVSGVIAEDDTILEGDVLNLPMTSITRKSGGAMIVYFRD